MRPQMGILALSTALVLGCDLEIRLPGGVRGSGVIKEESRNLPDFTELEVSSGLRITILIGPKEPVKVSGDDNLLPLIKTEVLDGRLHVGPAPNTSIQPRTPIEVTVTNPSISYVGAGGGSTVSGSKLRQVDFTMEASGGSTVNLADLNANTAAVTVSGGSVVTLSGTVGDLKVEMSGGSIVRTSKLQSVNVAVGGSGGSQADLQATAALKADLSGGSRVRVEGTPKGRDINTSGGSEVTFQ